MVPQLLERRFGHAAANRLLHRLDLVRLGLKGALPLRKRAVAVLDFLETVFTEVVDRRSGEWVRVDVGLRVHEDSVALDVVHIVEGDQSLADVFSGAEGDISDGSTDLASVRATVRKTKELEPSSPESRKRTVFWSTPPSTSPLIPGKHTLRSLKSRVLAQTSAMGALMTAE